MNHNQDPPNNPSTLLTKPKTMNEENNELVVTGLSSDGNMLVMKTWFDGFMNAERFSDVKGFIYVEGYMYAEGFIDDECSMYVEGFLIKYLNVLAKRIGLMVFGGRSNGNKLVMNARIKSPLTQLKRAERCAFLLGSCVVLSSWFVVIILFCI
ncbi:hypothetical protein Tco_0704349 [Tanacetum coccineum]|uniref:Uncharacterized protein n=1 Tax=Tanacetum coccineum TaxID=301880 RepID=A0ABQ4Y3G3_9ASTR